MQLEAANVLTGGGVRLTTPEGGKVLDVPNVILLRFLFEAARRHVLDHALAQWAVGLVEHRENSCLAWGWNPTILRQVWAVALLFSPP
jgi:hypothetical protein